MSSVPASGRFLLNSFSEQPAMAPRYTIGRKGGPNPTDQHVGSRVRMRRLMLAMSQEKLAAALGLTFQQVQKYEKGANRIGAGRLQHLSQILQVPVPFFFEGAPAPAGVRPAAPGTAEAPFPDYVSDSPP